jgi:hypothetical protein
VVVLVLTPLFRSMKGRSEAGDETVEADYRAAARAA